MNKNDFKLEDKKFISEMLPCNDGQPCILVGTTPKYATLAWPSQVKYEPTPSIQVSLSAYQIWGIMYTKLHSMGESWQTMSG